MFRIDPSTGCGDLMFSSHTIFAVLCVMVVWDYFPFAATKGFIAACLAALIPFTLASRKHYSVDVFTSLYVVPLVYELLRLKFPDKDDTASLQSRYGVRFAKEREDPLAFMVLTRRNSNSIHSDQLPYDFKNTEAFGIQDGSQDVEDIELTSSSGSYETIEMGDRDSTPVTTRALASKTPVLDHDVRV